MACSHLLFPPCLLLLAIPACFSDPADVADGSSSSGTSSSSGSSSSGSQEGSTSSGAAEGSATGSSSSGGETTTSGPDPTTATDTEADTETQGGESSSSTGEVPVLQCDEGFVVPKVAPLDQAFEIAYTSMVPYAPVELTVTQGEASMSGGPPVVTGNMPFTWTFTIELGNAFEPGVATATFDGAEMNTPFSAECEFFVE
ncbi:MAG: hypothetical protein ACE37F_22790 [Nannocystaceae bacterium]|nr:hypothetical protein [bacterium]